MPGPQAHPEGGKTKVNRAKGKAPYPNRNALGQGEHRPGSQNRNKNRGKRP